MTNNTTLKSLIAVAAIGVATASVAAVPGFNVGAQLGMAKTYYNDEGVTSVDTTKFAGRAYVGYNFTPNFGAEVGYAQFRVDAKGPDFILRHHAVDVSGKGIYALGNGIDLYGKLGLASVTKTARITDFSDTTRAQAVIGAGLTYNVMPNLPIEVGYTRYQKLDNEIASSDFGFVGIAYNFS